MDILKMKMEGIENSVAKLKKEEHEAEKAMRELTVSVELIKKDIMYIKEDIGDMLISIRTMAGAPAKRLNYIVTALISAVISSVATLLLRL